MRKPIEIEPFKKRRRIIYVCIAALFLGLFIAWMCRVGFRTKPLRTGSVQAELLRPANGNGAVYPHFGVGSLMVESYPTATIPSGWSEKAGFSILVPAESPKPSTSAVKLVSGFEGSMPLDAWNIDDTHIVVRFPSAATIWYLFKLENLQGRKVRIDFQNIRADRWLCNHPMYSDTMDLSDPVPIVDGELKEWHQVPKVWGALDAVSFEYQFPADSVYVATRVPYLPSYNQRYLSQLPKTDGMSIEQAGESLSGRPLSIVIFSGPGDAPKTRPCILVYAREHANESDASWAVQGMIEFLRSDAAGAKTIRDRFTVILIPLLDPDGAAVGAYDRITDSFSHRTASVEAETYAHWVEGWIKRGNRIDLVINIHNPALGPYLNLNFPMLDNRPEYTQFAADANAQIMSSIQQAGFVARTDPWGHGDLPSRFCGWLSHAFGAAVLPYEVNSQGLGHFIGVADMRRLGQKMLQGGTTFIMSQNGGELLEYVDSCRSQRSLAIKKLAIQLDSNDDPFAAEAQIERHRTVQMAVTQPLERR